MKALKCKPSAQCCKASVEVCQFTAGGNSRYLLVSSWLSLPSIFTSCTCVYTTPPLHEVKLQLRDTTRAQQNSRTLAVRSSRVFVVMSGQERLISFSALVVNYICACMMSYICVIHTLLLAHYLVSCCHGNGAYPTTLLMLFQPEWTSCIECLHSA